MIVEALGGPGRPDPLADQPGDDNIAFAVGNACRDAIAGIDALARLDGPSVEFDVATLARGAGSGSRLEQPDTPHPRIEPYFIDLVG